MRFGHQFIRLSNTPEGIELVLCLREITAETAGESRDLAKLLGDTASPLSTAKGGIDFEPAPIEDWPFEGKFPFCPKVDTDRASSLMITAQGLCVIGLHTKLEDSTIPDDITFEPIGDSPEKGTHTYAFRSGTTMDGSSQYHSVTLFSQDRERAMTILCVDSEILPKLVDQLGADPCGADGARELSAIDWRWQGVYDDAEILAIKVKTLEQAKNALAWYRPYLEDLADEEEQVDVQGPSLVM